MKKSILHQNCKLLFGESLNHELNVFLTENYKESKKVIITDENVYELWSENLISSVEALHQAEIIQIPAGEDFKTIEICYQIWETLSEYNIGRNDLIINLGGGVITDMGGFIASTYKRGLDFINIPTTLLSQVDASVGGKTGVDLGPHKNQIGVFSLPQKVFIDYNYLSTLTEDELLSGYAEMLKHGLINDKSHWKALTSIPSINKNSLCELIFDSVQIKHHIVTNDPYEKADRKSLNFGHTIGHAIEGYALINNKPVKHGFAVAWGMISECYIAQNLHLISKQEYDTVKNHIYRYFPSCFIKENMISEIVKLMYNDKKNENGEINFTLLDSIGNYKINQVVSKGLIENALRILFE